MKLTQKLSSVIAGFLLCVMLLSSCALFPKKAESPYIEGQRLDVVETEIVYTDSEMTEISMKLTNIASNLLFRRDGLVLTKSEKSELVKKINDRVENVVIGSNIAYSMAEELLKSLENRLSEDETEYSAKLFADLYLISIGKLGRDRASKLIFFSTIAYLDSVAKIFNERYQKYGYKWYLDDAEKFARLSREINDDIGYEKLADALGVVFFSTFIASGTEVFSGNEDFALDSTELLLLLVQQASYLDENRLESSQWQTVLELLFEICYSESEAPESFDRVEKEEYLAIRNCDYYALQLGEIMPYVTNLYIAAVNNLSAERLDRLMSTEASAVKIEFLNSVYMCKNEFFALSSRFHKLRFDSDYEKNALVRADVYEDYLKYEQHRKSATGADLYNAIGGYLTGRYDKEQLNSTFENYLFTSAPYFTYVFVFENRK